MSITIQQAADSDLRDILNLQYIAYQSEAKLLGNLNIPPLTQTLEEVENEFKNGIFLKATDEKGMIIGSVRAHSSKQTLYIGKLIVHPYSQGQGIGTKLVHAIENISPHQRYELFTSSKSVENIRLYKRLGYSIFLEKEIAEDLTFVYMEKIN